MAVSKKEPQHIEYKTSNYWQDINMGISWNKGFSLGGTSFIRQGVHHKATNAKHRANVG